MAEDPVDPRVMEGRAWEAVCEALHDAARIVTGPEVPALRAEGFRYLTRFLEAGIRSCVAYADPDHPTPQVTATEREASLLRRRRAVWARYRR